ncbi:hypothetical protein [Flavobacterium notoginsengisoli]|uniref:hypothetical protein n=1 Tax=Flavobacterium notoginsengisoli TaxID=1478199 RepID=UPI003629E01B
MQIEIHCVDFTAKSARFFDMLGFIGMQKFAKLCVENFANFHKKFSLKALKTFANFA